MRRAASLPFSARIGRVLVLAISCLALAGTAAASAADSTEERRAAAQALFEEGQEHKKEERFEEACKKFAASQKLDPAIGTQLNLADCYERIGRTASAWINYLDVAAKASKEGSDTRQAIAEQRAAALKPKLCRLQIDVAAPVEGLTIEREGVVMPEASWGTAMPVDPGETRISARAPGFRTWEQTVSVDEPGGVVAVAVPPLEAGAGGGDAGASGGSVAQLASGVAVGLLGVVGVVVGIGFTVDAQATYEQSKEHCPVDPNVCTAEGVALREDAQDAQAIYAASYIVGGALLVTGVVLLATAGRDGEREASEQESATVAFDFAPSLGPGFAGLGLRGRW